MLPRHGDPFRIRYADPHKIPRRLAVVERRPPAMRAPCRTKFSLFAKRVWSRHDGGAIQIGLDRKGELPVLVSYDLSEQFLSYELMVRRPKFDVTVNRVSFQA